jgi:hypothetical protein
VAKYSPPAPASGYVGGLFTKDTVVGFGFGLRDEQTKREHVLAVEDNDVGLIPVPPGVYRVAYWMTWSLTREKLTKKEIPTNVSFGRTFEVGAGRVMLLGKWSADREIGFARNTFLIVPQRISEREAVEAFRAAYPAFAGVPVGCLLCLP